MRKVRARLLKFNELLKDSDDDKKSDSEEKMAPKPVETAATTEKKGPKKKVSKWGKDGTTEASKFVTPDPQEPVKMEAEHKLSL